MSDLKDAWIRYIVTGQDKPEFNWPVINQPIVQKPVRKPLRASDGQWYDLETAQEYELRRDLQIEGIMFDD